MKADKPTHRQTCRAIARFLLEQPWADVVGWELAVSGSQFDVMAVSAAKSEETWRRALLGWEQRKEWSARMRSNPGLPPKRVPPRTMIAEVKMSRADLQAGLRRGQLERYKDSPAEPSHLLLVVWQDALKRTAGGGFWVDRDTEIALADLDEMGVPPFWGVARAHAYPRPNGVLEKEIQISVLRRPTRLHPAEDLLHRLGLAERMARSLAYRVLSPTSPETEGADD
jgi:hypothetical protein